MTNAERTVTGAPGGVNSVVPVQSGLTWIRANDLRVVALVTCPCESPTSLKVL